MITEFGNDADVGNMKPQSILEPDFMFRSRRLYVHPDPALGAYLICLYNLRMITKITRKYGCYTDVTDVQPRSA